MGNVSNSGRKLLLTTAFEDKCENVVASKVWLLSYCLEFQCLMSTFVTTSP